uniref:NADH-ubiquinone oxidoreductase chain 6 n=1 Tax=Saron marmoratus TaxID=1055079 RepID=A0A7G7WQH2_9EUCA|nr:NADH dehydrogenase subunit 6 [Saron marmoratus]QNH68799.1 NADH dehydrogenase subunit 6 [Saron marmoratus]
MSSLLLLSALSVTLSIMFTQMTHPLSLGLTLLIQTMLIVFTVSVTSKFTWFSYILFLIFLGAMLVLFIYMASLAPNEPFSSSTTLALLISTVMLTIPLIMTLDKLTIKHTLPVEKSSLSFSSSPSMESFLSMPFNPTSLPMTIFVITYLLLTLVVVVKITYTNSGPLRLS